METKFENINMKKYDYVIIGAGIAGCSTAYFLSKYSKSVLLIDKNSDIAYGASGAAGAFLSPLLGKPNGLKELVNTALSFSTQFYKTNFPSYITNCGTCRIPKDDKDEQKFKSYEEYMDFEYEKYENGYFFSIGSVVDSYSICKELSKDVDKLLSYEVENISKEDDIWSINSHIQAKNLILTTGANIDLIQEKYFNIRAVWGQRINIHSSTNTKINYHKACSLSKAKKTSQENKYFLSIGATHHRFQEDMSDTSYDLRKKDNSFISHNKLTKDIIHNDTEELLKLANEIKTLKDVEVLDVKIGARASSVDYFPMLGQLVDSKTSIEKYPHIVNGSFIKEENLNMIDNLFVLNGVGGRGYVLSPYLANLLVEFIINKEPLISVITTHRLFKRWAKRLKNKGNTK